MQLPQIREGCLSLKARRVLRFNLQLKKEIDLPSEASAAVQELERTHASDHFCSRDFRNPNGIQYEVYWSPTEKKVRVRVYTAYGEYEPKKAKA
jgi:hypothetical protein